MSRDIIIISSKDDKPAALELMEILASTYDHKCTIWTPTHFLDNEAQISSHQATICVGGPSVNSISKQYIGVCKALENDGETFVYIGFRKAVIYGYSSKRSTKTAVKVFIEHYLAEFLEEISD